MLFKRIAIVGSLELTTLTWPSRPLTETRSRGGCAARPIRCDAGEVRTALLLATQGNHVEAVRTLIDAGVNVDHVNWLGWTALLETIMLGDGSERRVRIVQLLVDAKANVNLADSNGETPLQHARSRGYAQIERILVAGRAVGLAGARFARGAGVRKLLEELAGQIHAVVERRCIAECQDSIEARLHERTVLVERTQEGIAMAHEKCTCLHQALRFPFDDQTEIEQVARGRAISAMPHFLGHDFR